MATVDIESGSADPAHSRERNDSHADENSTSFDTRVIKARLKQHLFEATPQSPLDAAGLGHSCDAALIVASDACVAQAHLIRLPCPAAAGRADREGPQRGGRRAAGPRAAGGHGPPARHLDIPCPAVHHHRHGRGLRDRHDRAGRRRHHKQVLPLELQLYQAHMMQNMQVWRSNNGRRVVWAMLLLSAGSIIRWGWIKFEDIGHAFTPPFTVVDQVSELRPPAVRRLRHSRGLPHSLAPEMTCCTSHFPRSSAMIGYGLEALVDMAASVLVLWRFWDSAETAAGARANEDREQRANVLIAFIVSASPLSINSKWDRSSAPHWASLQSMETAVGVPAAKDDQEQRANVLIAFIVSAPLLSGSAVLRD